MSSDRFLYDGHLGNIDANNSLRQSGINILKYHGCNMKSMEIFKHIKMFLSSKIPSVLLGTELGCEIIEVVLPPFY